MQLKRTYLIFATTSSLRYFENRKLLFRFRGHIHWTRRKWRSRVRISQYFSRLLLSKTKFCARNIIASVSRKVSDVRCNIVKVVYKRDTPISRFRYRRFASVRGKSSDISLHLFRAVIFSPKCGDWCTIIVRCVYIYISLFHNYV